MPETSSEMLDKRTGPGRVRTPPPDKLNLVPVAGRRFMLQTVPIDLAGRLDSRALFELIFVGVCQI